MNAEDEIECIYWEKVFDSLCYHNRESSRINLPVNEYRNQLEVIFEGFDADFIENEHSISISCRLRDNYNLFFDLGLMTESYNHIFVRFMKYIPNGNIQLCNPVFHKVPFWEINEFIHNFENYLAGLQEEFTKLPRKEKVTNLILEMIKAYLIKNFEEKNTVWKVTYEDGLYVIFIRDGSEVRKIKLTTSNWREEIVKFL
ncbi:MAG: hypothetical protein MJ179_01220 [Treponema sp.]|nr:hypothetical protein [Treponema sp.]